MNSGLGQVAYLARLRPADLNAALLFQASAPMELTNLFICNVSGSAATFRLFVTRKGDTTYDETTAMYWDKLVSADDTLVWRPESIGAGIKLDENDIVAVRASVANALNFTLYGVPAAVANTQLRG